MRTSSSSTQTSTNTDRIERSVRIAATAEHVWRIVSEPGWWINDGHLTAHRIDDRGDGTVVVHDPTHGAWHLGVERLDRPRYAAFRWLGRQGDDGRVEGANTLTEFWIEEEPDGVTLRVVESGFDAIPPAERQAYVLQNTSGWETELAAARSAAESS
jgi:uncharacterized protein YndB with AHSA1/START domain